jgi:hypothetical protein
MILISLLTSVREEARHLSFLEIVLVSFCRLVEILFWLGDHPSTSVISIAKLSHFEPFPQHHG